MLEHSRPTRRRAMATLALLSTAGLPWQARAQQGFPSKPIRLVVPFAPGGAVDVVARLVGNGVAAACGQPVVVENRTGAGGNIAASYVAKSEKDGYTLFMASTGTSVNGSLYKNLNYSPERDLVPIALVGAVSQVLLAHPSVQIRNFEELAAMARRDPKALNFGHGGAGTTEHLAAAMMNQKLGINVPLIAYKGGGPAMADLVGGQIQLMFTNQLNAMPFIKAGQLKAIAVTSAQRTKQLPDVPTCQELGVSGFVVDVWWGVMGPTGIPPAVIEKLNGYVNTAMATPEFSQRLDAVGAVPKPGTAAQFADLYASEVTRWAEVVRSANIQAE